ncbi:zinc ribbon domain-containing protein [Bacillus paramycoides]|uniref:zinc ribbon domain-containing protein n=1 Tax=Bacillus paramycoides TaxID=2026194 RepID=UPI002243E57A|nr:zinc ribbon domain-containing protein [Bacillus paramycoides]MCW9134310.1 zinc ribbon domain-containing protein [Bacillus paramycoides]
MKYCTQCGKENDDSSKFCGNCGEDFNPTIVRENIISNSNSNNGIEVFSLVSFIIGLISWFLNLWGIVGITAIIFSIFGLNKKVTGTSKTFAIIGMVSGAINVLYAFMILA